MTSKSIEVRPVQGSSIKSQLFTSAAASKGGAKSVALKARPRRSPSERLPRHPTPPREPRFFSILTDEQIRIAEKIARGFHLRTAGLGMRTQSYSRLPPSTGNAEDWQVDLMRRFMLWAVAMQEEGLSLATVVDVIVFGKSCRSVDKARKKRNGYARGQIIEALELYEKI